MSCINTHINGSTNPWWTVDLQVLREITFVRIYNRLDDLPYWSQLIDSFTLHVGEFGGVNDSICAEGMRAPE